MNVTLDSVMIAHYVAYGRPMTVNDSFVRVAALLELDHPGLLAKVQADQPRRVAQQSYQRARTEAPTDQYTWLANDFHDHNQYPVTLEGSVQHAV